MSTEQGDDPIGAARAEARRMAAAIGTTAEDGVVTMKVHQFRRLAALLDAVAQRAGRCDGDCFHSPVDGIRFWIPLPEVEAERAQLAALREANQPAPYHDRFAF